LILARPYRLRAETRSAYYLVRVLADPDADSTRLTTTDRLASVAGHDAATGRGGNAAASCAPVGFVEPVVAAGSAVGCPTCTSARSRHGHAPESRLCLQGKQREGAARVGRAGGDRRHAMTCSQVWWVPRDGAAVAVHPDGRERPRRPREVMRAVPASRVGYGRTTGVRADQSVTADDVPSRRWSVSEHSSAVGFLDQPWI